MKTLMREKATYTNKNKTFSMSLFGAHKKPTGEYIVIVEYLEEDHHKKVHKLEGEPREVFRTYEAMIRVMDPEYE